jgi:hypothetical protein
LLGAWFAIAAGGLTTKQRGNVGGLTALKMPFWGFLKAPALLRALPTNQPLFRVVREKGQQLMLRYQRVTGRRSLALALSIAALIWIIGVVIVLAG